MVKVCYECNCDIKPGDAYYDDGLGTCLCEECGDELLVSIDSKHYVYRDDYQDYYLDDEYSDLQVFEYEY